ncbi:MAG TPA: hypothetical protein PK668_16555 [Myxococcota bacterium]|nr:hypothetical protein [Myxococcota bacterium]HRY94769.1 hypothetical protein [Myxococcota bacterium]HSA21706.1 hypothetical protein [Myxococcota bacterium]
MLRLPCFTSKSLFLALGVACGSVWATGCGVPPVYRVERAALVPPPAPPLWSGRTQPIGFGAGNSSVVWKDPPRRDAGSRSGLYVSGIQFDGNLHFDLGPSGRLALWVPLSYGLSERAFAAAPCLVDTPSGGVTTAGVGVAYTQIFDEHWYLGMSLETMLFFVPSHVHTTCVANCDPFLPAETDEEDTSVVPVLRLGLAGGVELWVFRIFAGFYLRNHPTNVQVTHTVTYVPSAEDGDVEFGPLYAVLGLGVEAEIGPYVSVLAQLFEPLPLYEHDVIYGPIVGALIDVHAPRD